MAGHSGTAKHLCSAPERLFRVMVDLQPFSRQDNSVAEVRRVAAPCYPMLRQAAPGLRDTAAVAPSPLPRASFCTTGIERLLIPFTLYRRRFKKRAPLGHSQWHQHRCRLAL